MIEISENNVWLFSITHNSQKKTENAAVMETFNVYAQHSFNKADMFWIILKSHEAKRKRCRQTILLHHKVIQ